MTNLIFCSGSDEHWRYKDGSKARTFSGRTSHNQSNTGNPSLRVTLGSFVRDVAASNTRDPFVYVKITDPHVFLFPSLPPTPHILRSPELWPLWMLVPISVSAGDRFNSRQKLFASFPILLWQCYSSDNLCNSAAALPVSGFSIFFPNFSFPAQGKPQCPQRNIVLVHIANIYINLLSRFLVLTLSVTWRYCMDGWSLHIDTERELVPRHIAPKMFWDMLDVAHSLRFGWKSHTL